MDKIPVAWSRRRLEILRAPLPHMPRRLERIVLRILLLSGSRWITSQNEQRLRDHDGPLILALNHLNNLEAFFLPPALIFVRDGRKTSFLSDWMYRYYPVLGWLVRMSGTITVWHKDARLRVLNIIKRNRLRSGKAREDPMAEVAHRLEAGGCVAFYPEGKRNRDPRRLLRGHEGAARAALLTGAAVMPVGIDFVGREKARRVPTFPRIIIRFGEPLSFENERQALVESTRASSQGGAGRPPAGARRRLEKQITATIMRAIGALSGKQPEPVPALGSVGGSGPRGAAIAAVDAGLALEPHALRGPTAGDRAEAAQSRAAWDGAAGDLAEAGKDGVARGRTESDHAETGRGGAAQGRIGGHRADAGEGGAVQWRAEDSRAADGTAVAVEKVSCEALRSAALHVVEAVYVREKAWMERCELDGFPGGSSISWFLCRAGGEPAGLLRVVYDPPINFPPEYGVRLREGIDWKAIAARARIAEVGRFMIVERFRSRPRVAMRLMNAATREIVERGYTHLLTDVYDGDPHSPLEFHTRVLGFERIGTHQHGEMKTDRLRIILALDIEQAYRRMRARGGWIFREFTEGFREILEQRVGPAPRTETRRQADSPEVPGEAAASG